MGQANDKYVLHPWKMDDIFTYIVLDTDLHFNWFPEMDH